MKTEDLRNTPVERVWTNEPPYLVWDKYAPSNNLEELKEGETYHIKSSIKYILGDIQLEPWWNKVVWREPIEFVYGKYLKENWWDEYAKPLLFKLNLYNWLIVNNIKKIEAMEIIPWISPSATATIWQAERKIVVKDIPWGPPVSTFPASLLHEAEHMRQSDLSFATGFTFNPTDYEILAYMMNQLFHTLNGEDINVFDGKVYPGALGLLR